MIDTPHITRSTAQVTAVVPVTTPRSEMQQAMGAAITELMTTLAAQGIAPAGPLYSRHFRMDPATFDFEVGVPVASPVTPAGRVRPGEIPATTVARTIFHGNYDGLGAAWGEFDAWIKANGHAPAPDLWERYVTGPESTPDPAGWRTELNRPLEAGDR